MKFHGGHERFHEDMGAESLHGGTEFYDIKYLVFGIHQTMAQHFLLDVGWGCDAVLILVVFAAM